MADYRGKSSRRQGSGYVEKPDWNSGLKRRVLRKIRPDAEKMLAYMGKPSDYWAL